MTFLFWTRPGFQWWLLWLFRAWPCARPWSTGLQMCPTQSYVCPPRLTIQSGSSSVSRCPLWLPARPSELFYPQNNCVCHLGHKFWGTGCSHIDHQESFASHCFAKLSPDCLWNLQVSADCQNPCSNLDSWLKFGQPEMYYLGKSSP